MKQYLVIMLPVSSTREDQLRFSRLFTRCLHLLTSVLPPLLKLMPEFHSCQLKPVTLGDHENQRQLHLLEKRKDRKDSIKGYNRGAWWQHPTQVHTMQAQITTTSEERLGVGGGGGKSVFNSTTLAEDSIL